MDSGGIKRFSILYCVAVRPDLSNAVFQTKAMEHNFALYSHWDVGFSLCFLQQKGQELTCSWLCRVRLTGPTLPRDMSQLIPLPVFLGMHAVVIGKCWGSVPAIWRWWCAYKKCRAGQMYFHCLLMCMTWQLKDSLLPYNLKECVLLSNTK